MPENKSIVKREELCLGYGCNLNCRFCFYQCSAEKPFKDSRLLKKQILDIRRYGIEHIELSGGEPALHKDILFLIGFCKGQGFKTVCMITNGTLLKEKETVRQMQAAGLNQFVFSLHGHNAATHDYLTRGQSFDAILQAMENARSLGIPFRINTVVSRINYTGLEDIARLALERGALMLNFLFYSPLGACRDNWGELAEKYSLLAPQVFKAVDILKGRIPVRVRYLPFCLAKGYEAYLCNVHQLHYDPYEWDYCLREQLHNGRFYKWAKILLGLPFLPLSRLFGQKPNKSFHEAMIKYMCLANSRKILKCRRCSYYHICDGLWKDYVALYDAGELEPLRGKKITDPAQFILS